MPTKGRYLELLMKSLQAYLAPEGFKIQSPERFSKNGKWIGEIDVTVRGDMGMAKLFWGVECRDRPSEGPQGLPWIREIVGKKLQVKPDRMIAVSSTGFTDYSLDYAAEQNVELVVFEKLSEESLREQFPMLSLRSTNVVFETVGPIDIQVPDAARTPKVMTVKGASSRVQAAGRENKEGS